MLVWYSDLMMILDSGPPCIWCRFSCPSNVWSLGKVIFIGKSRVGGGWGSHTEFQYRTNEAFVSVTGSRVIIAVLALRFCCDMLSSCIVLEKAVGDDQTDLPMCEGSAQASSEVANERVERLLTVSPTGRNSPLQIAPWSLVWWWVKPLRAAHVLGRSLRFSNNKTYLYDYAMNVQRWWLVALAYPEEGGGFKRQFKVIFKLHLCTRILLLLVKS